MGDAQRTTRNSLKSEPYYAFEATEIRDGIWQVMDQMERFAMEEYSFDFPNNVTNLEKLTDAFRTMKPETVKIVALIASGGPGGSNGWRDLFFDSIKRQGLVCGIIGNVLEEQVFKHPFFGGKAEDIKALNELEEANIYGDAAFDLHSKTAEHIHKAVYNKETARLMLPVGFDAHVKTIVAAILTHLDFITRLDPKYSSESVDPTDEKTKLYTPLYRLVAEAGILSLYMRMDTRTVYHFVPTFKDQTYDNAAMACFNEEEMKATDPHTRKTWPANYTEAEKRRAEFDEPLVQIRIFEGVTAYRKGSWETSSSTAKNQRFVKAGGEDDGVRSRILTCSWVYCRWGRRKEFKDRKDVSDPEAHGMQWDGGFVNFSDVMGVPEFEGKGKGQVT
ncbi:hypothetical protein M011DRAFT_394626 [Sporormia fimetaria CBS 119925]|uniref:Uncharacterized protein n=1 Tax=Sporormia fimetaria CBS 119925 TaxID=1340428 RepID=A0A6A6VN69_9PLEO|nr:hypothetical protein M011DRAFT_394626 [Sporormia fimetaria CBS 119925]